VAQAKVGYAAMLEQFGPLEVTELSVKAEKSGFSGVMAADHFQPWVPAQGNASFVWSVMTAIAERTKGDVGPGVTCPSFRMHPAIAAEASAAPAALYPGRHGLGPGPGEVSLHRPAPPVVGTHRRGGAPQRDGRMAERRDEVSQAGHQEPARLRADGEARPAGGLPGADAHLGGPREASPADPEVHRP